MKMIWINTISVRYELTRICTAVFLLLVLNCLCIAEESPFRKPLPIADGFMIDGADGSISTNNGKWFFTPFESITDGKGVLTSAAEILPSSMLEKLTNVFEPKTASFRIWGKLTTYHGKNYVYLSYFLQVKKFAKPKDKHAPAAEKRDPNETSVI
ncbi:MAG TPA: hypothetical protein PK525_13670, partial [Anaerohalosphaeraceae bacterium]|nr:hypothetical protein [Anaerohalosphaeraceae bacterium]